MARVFVSHAAADAAFAEDVSARLRRERHRVFLGVDADAGLQVGDRWKERLFDEVRSAQAVVCIVSPASVASEWCAAEIAVADVEGVPLLPVGIADVTSELLHERQHLLRSDPDWYAKLAGALRRIDGAGGAGGAPRRPFPGLEPFHVGMQRFFHGRDDEARRLLRRLRSLEGRTTGELLLVVGPSGCGKSSLVRAGVAGPLTDDPGWVVPPPFTPGRDPVGALARALTVAAGTVAPAPPGLGWTLAGTVEALTADADAGPGAGAGGLARLVDELLLAAGGAGRRQLLVVVDQAEELLPPRTEPEAAAVFLRLVRRAMEGPVRVVMTLRSEFQDPLLALPELAGVRVGVEPLRHLAPGLLGVVIDEPARQAGLTVPPELVARLVADTGDGRALPLLAFTLEELTRGLDRGDTVPAERYPEGGVGRAVAHRAETALEQAVVASGLPPEQVVDALVRLVALDDEGRRGRRRVRLDTQPEPLRRAFQAFVDRHLLTSTTEADGTWLDVAHEALFSAWPPLDAAIEGRAESLRAALAVDRAAAEWEAGGHDPSLLWATERLVVNLGLLGYVPKVGGPLARADTGDLAAEPLAEGRSVDFLEASRSRAHAQRQGRRRRRQGAFAVLCLLVAVFGLTSAVAVVQWRSSESQQRLAAGRSLLSTAESQRGQQAGLSLQLGIAALDVAPGDDSRASLVSTLLGNRYVATVTRSGPVVPDDVPEAVQAVALSPDRGTLAAGMLLSSEGTADSAVFGVRLWDVRDRSHPRPLPAPIVHEGAVWALEFSPDGSLLALGGPGGSLALWDVRDPARPVHRSTIRPDSPHLWVTAAAFSRDGATLLMATWDNQGYRLDSTTVWDVADPTAPRRMAALPGGTGAVHDVALAGAGATLTAVTANDDGTVVLWDLRDPAAPRWQGTRFEHTNSVWAAEVSSDGRRVATAGADRRVLLWDLRDPARPRLEATLTGHRRTVKEVAFSPDGDRLVSASDDGTALLWSVAPGEDPVRIDALAGHTEPVFGVAFGSDGHTVATSGADGRVVLWEALDTAEPTSSGDLIDVDRGRVAAAPVAAHPDGRIVVTGTHDASALVLWDLGPPDGDRPPAVVGELPARGARPTTAAFSGDGDRLVVGAEDATVTVWDVDDPATPLSVAAILLGDRDRAAGTVALDHDGRVVAAGFDDGTAGLWAVDGPSPTLLAELDPRAAPVRGMSFTPDDRTLVQASTDSTLVLWDVADPARPRRRFARTGSNSVYWAVQRPDGRVLATAEEGRKSTLWDVADPDAPRRLAVLSANASSVFAVGFNAEGTILASGGFEKTVILWDASNPADPRRLATLADNDRVVSATTFVPDRAVLLVGDENSVTRWDVARATRIVADPAGVACEVVGEGLDPTAWHTHAPTIPYRPTCP